MARKFKLFAKANDSLSGELHLYGTIGGGGFFSDGISDVEIKDALADFVGPLAIYVNSPGGDVFQGTAIYNLLARYPGKKTVYVDGVCASIASVIAMAGNEIVTAPNALWMIHEPWSGVVGNADYMRGIADRMDKVALQMRDTYVARTNQSIGKITAIMAGDAATGETWLTASEAKDLGFTDTVGEFAGGEMNASFPLLDRYAGTPEPLRAMARSPKAVLASMTRQVYLDSIRGPVR